MFLLVGEGNATPLIEVLSKAGTRIVITSGKELGPEQFSRDVAILKKPYAHDDLVKVIAWLIDGGERPS